MHIKDENGTPLVLIKSNATDDPSAVQAIEATQHFLQ
jgi:hypothetical protein